MTDHQPKQDDSERNLHVGKIGFSKSMVSIIKKVALLGILALAVLYLLPQLSSIENSLKVLSTLKPWAISLAIIAQFISYSGNGMTTSECVKLTGNKITTLRGMLIALTSASIGLVAGGMFGSTASTFRWVKASGGGNDGSSLAASLPPIFVDIALLAVSVIGLVFLLFVHDLTRTQVISFSLVTLLLIALAILCFLAVKHQKAAIEKMLVILEKFYVFFKKDFPKEQTRTNLEKLFATGTYLIKGGWKGPLKGASFNIFFDMLTLYFVFLASGKSISVFVLIAGYGLPWLIGRMAFIFPGGVGVIESAMVALFITLGIDKALATIAVLVYRVISFWVPSLIGFIVLPILNAITGKKPIQD
jgi:uncharacterized protein (TIRG00374 family)